MRGKQWMIWSWVCAACVILSACAGGPRTHQAPAGFAEASADNGSPASRRGLPESGPKIARVLHAMGDASTLGHPDLKGLFAGMRAFYKGDYQRALKDFREGARYAGKLSQLTIGLMYLHGRGVAKDPATACAWFALAAERGYPAYEATRARTCSALDAEQHAKAAAVLARLEPEYGDAVAVPRMKRALTFGMQQSVTTGSYLGDASQNVIKIYPNSWEHRCLQPHLKIGGVVVPIAGCGLYDPKLWNANKYFAARVPRLRGIVTVGKLQASKKSTSHNRPDDDAAAHAGSSHNNN